MKKFNLLCYFVFFSLAISFAQNETKFKWQHFDADVFKKAKKENKLVLLHLRANWCHWCHVMEEKTYTNKAVLKYLQANYITCMEDHDERQDLTSLYNDYGWPATIIFDANGNELLKEAGYFTADEYLTTLKDLKKNPKKLESNIVTMVTKSVDENTRQASLKTLEEKFRESLDIALGGFVFGQKYVEFDTFEYALEHAKKDSSLKQWVQASMANSAGLYDKEWGGIFQYSTDNDWQHIHYEKLLFIQARYIKMYCWYYKLYNDKSVLERAEGITKYVSRFLATPQGGFYNAQDADLVAGEKAIEYYKLNNDERLKKGIPPIDSNIYTSDNAQYAEALTILWAASGDQKYLTQALNCVDFILAKRKSNTTYMHGARYSSTISLKDNIAFLKTLMLVYRATQKEIYKKEARELVKNIATDFNSNKGYLYTYIGSSAIKATYNISENIDACRLLNYASYYFNEPAYKSRAVEIFNFLTDPNVVKTLSTEPGILSTAEEIKIEPTTAALMLKKTEDLKNEYLQTTISCPHFYFNSVVYTKENIIEDKKDLFEAFETNFMILCTSSYCSSPMDNIKDFRNFLYKRVLKAD
jgi:uncharacterized protein YyaL (SSP411 family)